VHGTNGSNGAKGANGADGAQGPAGPKGATGPQGPAGQVQVITCKSVSVKSRGHSVKRRQCTTKVMSGTVKFRAAKSASATLSRGRVTYATGTASAKGLVLRAQRRVPAGRYTLTLHYRQGQHRIVKREQIRIG
jgi:hypothetical protein